MLKKRKHVSLNSLIPKKGKKVKTGEQEKHELNIVHVILERKKLYQTKKKEIENISDEIISNPDQNVFYF